MIYNISQDFPMGYENEVLKKNFYINMGTEQGLADGTELYVYRLISRNNPYAQDKQERVHYRVKVGTVKVIHTESNHAIAEATQVFASNSPVFFEVNALMIGDYVDIKVD